MLLVGSTPLPMALRRLFSVAACLSLVHSQSFPDGPGYDFDIPTLSDECQEALNHTVQCSWLLPLNDVESLELSSSNLTTVCTEECQSTLKSTRSSINAACPPSNNQIVVDGIAYPATETIERLLHLYDKMCLKDA